VLSTHERNSEKTTFFGGEDAFEAWSKWGTDAESL